MQPNDPSAETQITATNRGFITQWKRLRVSREVQLFGLLHRDIFNVPLYLMPDVRLQIRLNKARPSFYLMKESVDSKRVFKFYDA